MKKLTEKDYRISDWSGGKTIQIAIAPESAQYADRRFSWRLSSATVDLEESDFTSLPDYQRLIAPLRGEMRLTHNGGTPVDLRPYEVHRFDGADTTHSWGSCTDFNLMLRKGEWDGSISAPEGETVLCPEPGCETLIVYCTRGGAAVSCGDESVELAEREAVLLADGPTQPVRLILSPGGRAMCAQVWKI